MLSGKRNKRIGAWLCLAMFLLFFKAHSQITFNKRLFADNKTVFESIYPIEEGYLASGWLLDTIGQNHIDLVIYGFDLEGNELWTKRYGEADRAFWSIENSSSLLDNRFLQQSTGTRDGVPVVTQSWFNEMGDTIFTRDFESLYFNNGWDGDYFVSTIFSCLNADSTSYLCVQIFHETTFNDAVLYKLDPQGHELWHYVHATLSDPDVIYAVVPHRGGVIAGINQFIYAEDSTNVLFKKFASNGDTVWEINSNDFIDDALSCNSLIMDGDSLVGCGKVLPYSVNDYYPIASVFKIDTLGTLIWSNTYGAYTNFEWRDFTNVVKTTDGNYVCGGTWTTVPGSEEIPIGQVNDDYDQFAHIVKFDRDNGDIIWERNYRWLETYRDNHSLNDMKATPDGGVIFCGEANDTYHIYEPPYQQAWVVKLDACGCLVPGCDEECFVGVSELPEGPGNDSKNSKIQVFKFGPNPVSDLLNVYVGSISNADLKNASIAIYDLQGKLMKSFVVKYANTTYMMDVSEMASGEYVMGFMNDGVVLQSEKLVVAQR